MKKIGMIIVAVLATACVLAQEKPRRGRGGGHQRGDRPAMGERPMHGPMMHAAGAWVPRMLANKANLEKIGVTDEALRHRRYEKNAGSIRHSSTLADREPNIHPAS